jgi:hypothetical protein
VAGERHLKHFAAFARSSVLQEIAMSGASGQLAEQLGFDLVQCRRTKAFETLSLGGQDVRIERASGQDGQQVRMDLHQVAVNTLEALRGLGQVVGVTGDCHLLVLVGVVARVQQSPARSEAHEWRGPVGQQLRRVKRDVPAVPPDVDKADEDAGNPKDGRFPRFHKGFHFIVGVLE